MDEPENATTIDERAAEWVVRMERDDFDAAARAELEAWLDGDRRRRGALLRAEAGWSMLDRASVLAGGARLAAAPRARRGMPRRWLLAGLGGAAAAGIGGLVVMAPWRDRYRTALGEVRSVPLPDGSLAAINTESAVDVAMHPRLRSIRLDRGEAWFQVVKDRHRPFVVAAGDVRIRAVGTAFSVRRRQGGAEVQVTEGVVEAWSVAVAGRSIRVAAGSKAFITDSAGPAGVEEASTTIDRSLAWRSGQVILDGDTLAEAAAEFNRYNARKIVVADDALAQERLVGRFRTNEPDAFASAAAGMLHARVVMSADEISLARAGR